MSAPRRYSAEEFAEICASLRVTPEELHGRHVECMPWNCRTIWMYPLIPGDPRWAEHLRRYPEAAEILPALDGVQQQVANQQPIQTSTAADGGEAAAAVVATLAAEEWAQIIGCLDGLGMASPKLIDKLAAQVVAS